MESGEDRVGGGAGAIAGVLAAQEFEPVPGPRFARCPEFDHSLPDDFDL